MGVVKDKIVGTTEVGFLLTISVSRVKVLLQQQRIKGAKKEGRIWKIPLFKGIPKSKNAIEVSKELGEENVATKPSEFTLTNFNHQFKIDRLLGY